MVSSPTVICNVYKWVFAFSAANQDTIAQAGKTPHAADAAFAIEAAGQGARDDFMTMEARGSEGGRRES